MADLTIQENVGVGLIYGIQSDGQTVASSGGTSQYLRRASTTLVPQKDTFASNEARADQQISDFRHGGRRGAGTIDGELSVTSYDDFLAALQRNTWSAGVALTQSDFTSLTISAGVVTFGSGNPSTLGLRVGDVIDMANLSVSGNNDRYRITGLTSTTITVIKTSDGTAPADNTTDTSCGITVVGHKLINGLVKKAFTIEKNYPTADVSQLYKHSRISGAQFAMPPNGIATASWQIMARDVSVLSGGSAPYFSAPAAAPNTALLTGIDGGLRLNGVEQGIVTGMDLAVSLNMTSTPVVGTPISPEIFFGRTIITGNVSYYLQDVNLLNVFMNETEVDLVVVCKAPDGSFITFNMQRVKMGGAQDSIGTDGGAIVQAPFQALLKSAGTGYDATTLSIQRST